MNINFEIASKVWWRKVYFPYSNEEILSIISKKLAIIKDADTDEEAEADFASFYKKLYLTECLNGEGNVANKDLSYIEARLETDFPAGNIDLNDPSYRELLKIKNMFKAIDQIFPTVVFPSVTIDRFDEELPRTIHRIIGDNGLIPNAGEYRTQEARPAQEDFRYLESNQISHEMSKLFANTRTLWTQHQDSIECTVKIAATFLSNFLLIHPFSNANGRVARILVSYLLSNISVVPLSLTDKSNRETYLDCLRESQRSSRLYSDSPTALAALILERVLDSVEFYYFIVIRPNQNA